MWGISQSGLPTHARGREDVGPGKPYKAVCILVLLYVFLNFLAKSTVYPVQMLDVAGGLCQVLAYFENPNLVTCMVYHFPTPMRRVLLTCETRTNFALTF